MSRNGFTNSEDKHLIEFIATHNPGRPGRSGNNLYKTLTEDVKARPWSTTHTWQSWRDRYVKHTDTFDPEISRFLKERREARNKEQSEAKDESRKRKRSPSAESKDNPPIPDAKPKKALQKRHSSPARDSGFCESSPSLPASPGARTRSLPRLELGVFGNRLAPRHKRSKFVKEEEESDDASRAIPLVSSQSQATRPFIIPAVATARLAAKKRATTKTQLEPANSSVDKVPETLTAYNKPGESSKVTLNVHPAPTYDNDDPFVDHPVRLQQRKHTEAIPRIDLSSVHRRTSLSAPRSIPDKDVLLERGISAMIADWVKEYRLSEETIRPMWNALQDIKAAELVLQSMRKAADAEMNKGISDFKRRQSSGARRVSAPKDRPLEIVLLSDDDEVDNAYEPPSNSRAGKYLRLARQGRNEEAKERDQRRASGGRNHAKRLLSSPTSIKHETPSPPERVPSKKQIWGFREDLMLSRLNSAGISDARALEESFGFEVLLDKVYDMLSDK